MKKAVFASILFVTILSVFVIMGCEKKSTGPEIIEIRENMFISQINSINLNSKDYLGKTIKLEGFIKRNHWNDKDYYFVIRNAPGCCGDDGEIGFEVSWNPDYMGSGNPMDERSGFPAVNDWVEAKGELKSYRFMGTLNLFLVLSEIKVLENRGVDFVTR